MKKQIPTTREEIYCDICGKVTNESCGWSVTLKKDSEIVGQYGNGYTNTGDWCADCTGAIVSMITNKLDELKLVERYDINHSGNDKTIEQYKKIISS